MSFELCRYVDRFRHGAPMSREERLQREASGRDDFWWLRASPPTPSDASTPKDDENGRTKKFTGSFKVKFSFFVNQLNVCKA